MAREPLLALIKVRRLACDDAQRSLAAALAAEAQAEDVSHMVERVIAEETLAAADPAGSDAIVEAFGVWLPGARRKLAELQRVLDLRQAETARARAELTACRTALESVEALVQERQEAIRLARERDWEREVADRPRRRSTDGL